MRARRAAARSTPQLEQRVVVTIMGAVAAELQSIGHRPNFFYLQHAMGLASSMGLGIALVAAGAPGRRVRRRRLAPDEPRRPDDAGALPAAQPRPRRLRQREPAVGRRVSRPRRRPAATSPASPRRPACRAPRPSATLDELHARVRRGARRRRADDASSRRSRRSARRATSPTCRSRKPLPVSAVPAIVTDHDCSTAARRRARRRRAARSSISRSRSARRRRSSACRRFRAVARRDDRRRSRATTTRGRRWYWNTLRVRRAHRHALRRAGPLDHRQGSAGQRLRHDSGARASSARRA